MTGTVYRVWWTPGQDQLTAVCHCGARRDHDDPIAAWAWLLEHPDGHDPPGGSPGASPIDGRLDTVDAER